MCMHTQIRAHVWAREHVMCTHAYTHAHSFSCLQTFAHPAFSSKSTSFPTPGLQEAEPPRGCSRSPGVRGAVTCAPTSHLPSRAVWDAPGPHLCIRSGSPPVPRVSWASSPRARSPVHSEGHDWSARTSARPLAGPMHPPQPSIQTHRQRVALDPRQYPLQPAQSQLLEA